MVLLLGAFAASVAYFVNRRGADSPSVPKNSLPIQIDRRDFDQPETSQLLVLFSSETCDSCDKSRELIKSISIDSVCIQEVEFPKHRNIHERYGIDSVPIILVADTDGVVIWSYAGIPPDDLFADMVSSLQAL
tara:strand:+ start:255 stop:653 length:399 start_codon:yes stop_codon:yes gene_type:complete